jgi:sarcosine oxidase subunit gamma
MDIPARLSPVHDELQHLHPCWGEIHGMPAALDFGDRTAEQDRARRLGLCDVSPLPRLEVKGPNAAAFLESHHIAVPPEIFDVLPWGSGGVIARTGGAAFLLEDGPQGSLVAILAEELDSAGPGVYPAPRADAALLLSGTRAADVLLQTCGYDFRRPGPKLVMTRVAGVSASVLHRTINNIGAYQLWVDGTFGVSLWETLLEIVRELGGDAAGLSAFFPELIA